MILDGEYRTAFIDDEHPELNYGTAPFPAADDQTGPLRCRLRHGQHHRGSRRGAKNEAAAWELVKYLTTDTDALVKLANRLRERADDAGGGELAEPATWCPSSQTFLDIFNNPNTETNPVDRRRAPPTRRSSSPSSTSTRQAR